MSFASSSPPLQPLLVELKCSLARLLARIAGSLTRLWPPAGLRSRMESTQS